ncbi:MAG: hypothetical protein DWH99_09755 [Planctomycetota bacterium]|nr:MAG: hypothetical protein DWH99_09755 [Planctomycetota bacterium]
MVEHRAKHKPPTAWLPFAPGIRSDWPTAIINIARGIAPGIRSDWPTAIITIARGIAPGKLTPSLGRCPRLR